MNPLKFPPLRAPLKFYAVVPDAAWVERMVKAGADTVQLRNKTLSGEALREEIRRCVAAVAGSDTQLFINDYWREAIAEGAYGVHLGQEDMDSADLAAIAAAGLPTRMDAVAKTPFAAEALVRHMGQDKKAQGGKLTFILARALGDTFVAKDVSAQAVRDFLVSEGARP